MAQPTQPYRQNSFSTQQNTQGSTVVNDKLMRMSNNIRQTFNSTMIPLLNLFRLIRESDKNMEHNDENFRQTNILIDELKNTLEGYNVMYISRSGSSRRRKTVKKRK